MLNSRIACKKILSYLLTGAVCLGVMAGCAAPSSLTVEDEVEKALSDERQIEGIDETDPDSVKIPGDEDKGLTADAAGNAGANAGNVAAGIGTNAGNTASGSGSGALASDGITPSAGTGSANGKNAVSVPRNINPFLGDGSTATSFNIGFNIETDSGLAGITWGSTDGTEDEYYLFAFDCTREFPRLYTARRKGEDVYDEVYTNLDFMYPEMIMFSSVEHVVEIRVSGTTATTYLDKYKVCDTLLNAARPVGQIGVWVMEGDYHEYIDNLFVAEGYDGTGEWIYSDDFARRDNLFAPELKTRQGRLYVTAGYHTAPSKKAEK